MFQTVSQTSSKCESIRTGKRQDPLVTLGNQALLHRLQAKLAISRPEDPAELEADRVADHVMRMPDPVISRKCAVLNSPGRPLDAATRSFFEPRFGADFSQVQVHAGSETEQSARDVNASAYTVGHHIVFAPSRFAPATDDGRRLLAHELTHVVQQTGEDRNRVVQVSPVRTTFLQRQPPSPTAPPSPAKGEITRENPYKPSPKIPDLDEDVVKNAEQSISAGRYQEAIDTLLKDTVAIGRVNLDLLQGKTMHYDSTLTQEGQTDNPPKNQQGQTLPINVRIGPPAFKLGVSWFYSTLLHEYVHVEQFQPDSAGMPVVVKGDSTDPGFVNKKEVEAYAFEITHAGATGLKSAPDRIAEIWGRLCHAYDFMMPFQKRSVEDLARKAYEQAKSIVGANRLNDCLKSP